MSKGYWGNWYNPYGMLLQGSYDEFIIYNGSNHPSSYIFKVKIYGMSIEADKQAIKRRIKNKQWYEYRGSVEYYTRNNQIGFNSQVEYWPRVSPSSTEYNVQLNTQPAIIKIAPYKKNPRIYNIFFESYGIGIEI